MFLGPLRMTCCFPSTLLPFQQFVLRSVALLKYAILCELELKLLRLDQGFGKMLSALRSDLETHSRPITINEREHKIAIWEFKGR